MASVGYVNPTASQSRSATAAARLSSAGAFVLRYSLVFFLFFFGALKWTPAEARGIEGMVSHSPVLFWLYPLFGVQGGSEVIGIIELAIGILIDAFLVRITLTPALMALFGDKAWWLPRWLDRILPDLDVEGDRLLQMLIRREDGEQSPRSDAVGTK